MSPLERAFPPGRFRGMNIEHAPGQEMVELPAGLKHVDFSHGDVGAFPPLQEVGEAVAAAFQDGGRYAYSPYRGHLFTRELIAPRLSRFTGSAIEPNSELIVTPGTQGGLFLALSSVVEHGDKVAIVEPDYFANRRIVEYLEAEAVPVNLGYRTAEGESARLDLDGLRSAFKGGAKVFVFSNPNNPTGIVYTEFDIIAIADLAKEFDALVVVDALYSRQVFAPHSYTHLRPFLGLRCITLIGPSKTESVSGCRVGVAIAPPTIIERMEQLQGIATLRAAGYMQAALEPWFAEPAGWLDSRVAEHRQIRDDVCAVIDTSDEIDARPTEGGSYLFLDIPSVSGALDQFVKRLRTDAAVTVTRGVEFGNFHSSVRLNFSQNKADAVDAMGRIAEVASTFRPE